MTKEERRKKILSRKPKTLTEYYIMMMILWNESREDP